MAKNQNPKVSEAENIENALTKTEVFIEKYRKEILIGLGAVVAVVLAVLAFNNFYKVPAEKEAQDKLVFCVQQFERDSFNLALNGDEMNAGFATIVNDYGITKAANLAAVYAGICCYNLGDFEQAIKYLDKFDANSVNISPAVVGLIGDCYVEMGNYETAVSYFEKAAKEDNELTAPRFLKKAGMAYEELGRYDKAEKAYAKIKADYVYSSEASDIDRYIAVAKEKQGK